LCFKACSRHRFTATGAHELMAAPVGAGMSIFCPCGAGGAAGEGVILRGVSTQQILLFRASRRLRDALRAVRRALALPRGHAGAGLEAQSRRGSSAGDAAWQIVSACTGVMPSSPQPALVKTGHAGFHKQHQSETSNPQSGRPNMNKLMYSAVALSGKCANTFVSSDQACKSRRRLAPQSAAFQI